MSYYGTVVQQGFFTSTGVQVNLNLVTDVDWIMTRNYTTIGAGIVASTGLEFFWQRGMANNDAIITWYNGIGGGALAMDTRAHIGAAAGGFTLLDTSNAGQLGPVVAFTAISNANPPVVASVAHGLVTGQVVRIQNAVAAEQISGRDFTITRVDADHFSLTYMSALAVASTGGTYQVVQQPAALFYPANFDFSVTKISLAQNAVVTLSVNPLLATPTLPVLTVGQKVRMRIPSIFGMPEMDMSKGNLFGEIGATIVAIGQVDADGLTNTISLDIDSRAFTPFAWPTAAAFLAAGSAMTFAQAVPFGENTAYALAPNIPSVATYPNGVNILADATYNTAFRGISLLPGQIAPAGVNGNVIYWVAGKSANL